MRTMTAKNIQRVNEAVYILRNFIDLSAHLLPFLVKLQYSKKLSTNEIKDKENIIDVYRNYTFDKETSMVLMNSSILELIEKSYKNIVDSKNSKLAAKKQLVEFRKEHKRLQKSWLLIDSN
jgi:hypothetical protein